MATRTVSNAGGNWNATTTWAGGIVPTTGDDINFTATSGNLSVNVATANLIGINFTNYVGTITFLGNITTSGVLNLGTGGYTQLGASGIVLNGATTITSGGVTWSRPLTFGGASVTYTLVGNLTVTGLITFQGSGTTTFTNNILNINGGLTQTTTGIYAGTTAFVFGGTGTWSNSGGGAIRNNTTINTAGTLTISGSNINYNTGIFTYTAGTVITTGSTLNIAASTTFNTAGMSWNNIAITTGTLTLNNLFSVSGTMTLSISTVFAGTAGFSVATLIASGTGLTHQLVSTVTYTINTSFTCTTATSASRVLFRSTTPGSQAILTVQPGVTIDLGFVNATDINSSLGRPIYSYKGVFSNTLNWGLLPTDNTRSNRSTFVG
jgi:hypothetical protein